MLEAGRPDYKWDVFIHMPAALMFAIGNRFYDWKYESEPEPHMNGRKVYHARGKVLGGSSSINGQIFQRGNPMDYERWAGEPGMESWAYANCLPYFKRHEDHWRGADEAQRYAREATGGATPSPSTPGGSSAYGGGSGTSIARMRTRLFSSPHISAPNR